MTKTIIIKKTGSLFKTLYLIRITLITNRLTPGCLNSIIVIREPWNEYKRHCNVLKNQAICVKNHLNVLMIFERCSNNMKQNEKNSRAMIQNDVMTRKKQTENIGFEFNRWSLNVQRIISVWHSGVHHPTCWFQSWV